MVTPQHKPARYDRLSVVIADFTLHILLMPSPDAVRARPLSGFDTAPAHRCDMSPENSGILCRSHVPITCRCRHRTPVTLARPSALNAARFTVQCRWQGPPPDCPISTIPDAPRCLVLSRHDALDYRGFRSRSTLAPYPLAEPSAADRCMSAPQTRPVLSSEVVNRVRTVRAKPSKSYRFRVSLEGIDRRFRLSVPRKRAVWSSGACYDAPAIEAEALRSTLAHRAPEGRSSAYPSQRPECGQYLCHWIPFGTRRPSSLMRRLRTTSPCPWRKDKNIPLPLPAPAQSCLPKAP